MNLIILLTSSALILLTAYFTYGKYVAGKLKINNKNTTPAHTHEDGIDYIPSKTPVVLGHHFASIAGAGPIIGPIIAIAFGWIPAVIWILVGGIFFGAVHDLTSMLASMRHDGKSIGVIIQKYIGRKGKQLFLIFSFATLILVIAVFADIIAKTFVTNPGVASAQWKAKMESTGAYKDLLGQEDLQVIFTGVCDLYDIRAENALGAVGKKARRYRSYQDMMASPDIDAVLIATPDHMHARMVIEAARAGKHVYVEKCMTHTIEEVHEVYDAVKKSGVSFQLGHQLRQKDSFHQAKDLLHLDILGKISLIQTTSNRNSPNGAWVYDIPTEANKNNIDWKQFNPDRPFDADRFFRWRKYWDYGTGLSGDLLTHELDSINYILDLGIPYSAIASGGIYFFQDGREVPDVFQVTYEFPKKNFSLFYSATLANDSLRPNLIMGHDATMHLGNKVEIWANSNSTKYKDKMARGIIKADQPFFAYPSEEADHDSVDAMSGATNKCFAEKGMMSTHRNGRRLDPTHLHIMEWLYSIRNGGETSCNIEAGFTEAVTAHMATLSYKTGKKVIWNEMERKFII